MKQLIYSVLIVFLITKCTPKKPIETEAKIKGLTESEKKANIDEAVTYDLISVEIGATQEQLNVSQQHLYGKFFDDRAEFYIVENPDLYVSEALVNRLTLYFIDGTLCKKKYELDTDISQELMKAYGGFRFKALNDTTYKLSREENIVVKSDTGNFINDSFNRYQMKWEDEGVAIKYLVFKDTTAGQLELVEELISYKDLLRAAELEI
ncbi:hypothetical protein [Marinoscillum pacificum]|uniref:hypothetical protein n=1 Tax=Marinoscillum pacificum TaxID=392723 RepID=UPI00215804B3|nr:hypothetical protein [Marinoscillum pacificum]